MPPNWDRIQKITNGRVDFPTGPLDLTGNQKPKWVDAWIVQASTGSAETYYGSASSGAFAAAGHWVANVRHYNRGTFRPGPAVGIALVYWTDDDQTDDDKKNGYVWWSEDPIELEDAE